MNAVNLTRATMGATIMTGLLVYQPLAYFVSGVMIVAGLSGK